MYIFLYYICTAIYIILLLSITYIIVYFIINIYYICTYILVICNYSCIDDKLLKLALVTVSANNLLIRRQFYIRIGYQLPTPARQCRFLYAKLSKKITDEHFYIFIFSFVITSYCAIYYVLYSDYMEMFLYDFSESMSSYQPKRKTLVALLEDWCSILGITCSVFNDRVERKYLLYFARLITNLFYGYIFRSVFSVYILFKSLYASFIMQNVAYRF